MALRNQQTEPEPVYEVTVWDWEGNIVKKLWEAPWSEVEDVQGQYEDEPGFTVVVEER